MKNFTRIFLRETLILAILALISVGSFIALASYQGFVGFPLDDAWIHQVYARNLVLYGEWSFNPGQPSGGSTSPLWSFFLSGAYIFHLAPVLWSGFLGWLALSFSACLVEATLRAWVPAYHPRFPWGGMFFITEWHMLWTAVSGMETMAYIGLVLTVFYLFSPGKRRYELAGLVVGLCTWVRPDGITLLGPIFLCLIFDDLPKIDKFKRFLFVTGGFLLFFIPYLQFNLKLAGSIWPTTFSAKQAEYQASTGLPFLERLWNLFLPFLAGGGVILVPGVAAALVYALRVKKIDILAGLLWFTGYLLMYAVRLPVNYQHGRYMMPAMSVFFLIGLSGMIRWMMEKHGTKRYRMVPLFWKYCLAAVTILFLCLGWWAYKTDVAIIQTEMVKIADWARENTPVNSRIAAHDIGALGYFSNREIIDLAGLINPDVIPIIRDEKAIKNYLDDKRIDYLITFPGWYPILTGGLTPVFTTESQFSPESGGENMAVYRWK